MRHAGLRRAGPQLDVAQKSLRRFAHPRQVAVHIASRPGPVIDRKAGVHVRGVYPRRARAPKGCEGFETLREEFPDVVDAEPELIAHHFTQAGLTELAIEYWGKAGDLALRRSAFKEAIAHLGKAIEMTEALQGAGQTDKTGEKLKLQVVYGNAMIAAHGHGAPTPESGSATPGEIAAVSLITRRRSIDSDSPPAGGNRSVIVPPGHAGAPPPLV